MVNEIKEKETREDVEVVVDEVVKTIINFVDINKDKIFSKRMGDYESTMQHILLKGLKFMKKIIYISTMNHIIKNELKKNFRQTKYLKKQNGSICLACIYILETFLLFQLVI